MSYVLIFLLTPIALGLVFGFFFPRKLWAGLVSIFAPWLTLLAFLLYNEYCVPYKGGGFSFWPISLVLHGTVLALCGGVSYLVISLNRKRA